MELINFQVKYAKELGVPKFRVYTINEDCQLVAKTFVEANWWLIVLGFNDTSTLVGHFCPLPENGRREIDEREGQERKRKMNESEKTEETRKSLHRTRMPLPKCYSEKGYICNCVYVRPSFQTRFTIWNLVKDR